ncbi:hypothetical protein FB45DRAFT_943144 [Roridomyces roridus]|uniref:MYND-type domain-containing protein n=1 Tax=Roridomyces roridus TaxID=1738132 RepID=A0AAD7FBX8_9AGAR|nr:hypothetical protein FB45DRAFT_943144 [Roridomyces roridus]
MHPALQMRTIKQLPPSIRDIVSRIAKASRTSSEVAAARQILLDVPSLTPAQRLAFLPAFLANLDPDKVPRSEQLDDANLRPAIRKEVECAVISMDAIFNSMSIPKDVGPSLWPRIWAWFNFVHVSGLKELFLLLGIRMYSEDEFYVDFMIFVNAISEHKPTHTLVATTPGFRACLVKAWECLPEIDKPAIRTILLHTLSDFVGNITAPSQFKEVLEAAGSIDHLASLVLLFVRTGITGPLLESSQPAMYIHNFLGFVVSGADCPEETTGEGAKPLGPLLAALCGQNFPQELMDVILFLCDRWEDKHVPTVTDAFLRLVRHILQCLSANIWLPRLIERGLLRALALVTLKWGAGVENSELQLDDQVRVFLHHILPAGLVFSRSVSAFQESYAELIELTSQDDFKQSPLFDEWDGFCIAAKERVGVLNASMSDDFVTYKACDNCGIIQQPNFMAGCCSGCTAFYYCSRECQIADWRAGHRDYCDSHETLFLTQRSTDPKLTFSERSFIRTLTSHTYLAERRSVCAQQVKIFAAHPVDSPPLLITLFDFCEFPPVVTVEMVGEKASENMANTVDLSSDEWADLARRLERGRGRIDLHAVRITVNCKVPREWIIPLRSESAAIHVALTDLANRVRKGEVEGDEDILDAVDEILVENGTVMEIH